MEVEAWAAEGFRCVICGVKTVRVFKGFAYSGGIERHYGPEGWPHDKELTTAAQVAG